VSEVVGEHIVLHRLDRCAVAGALANQVRYFIAAETMVVIHIKRTDLDQFLFETTITESNDTLIRNLVRGKTRLRARL
jgi:hypothetical protein